MTIKELILKLMRMPQEAEATAYEAEAHEYLRIARLEIADNGNEVKLITQYAMDAGYEDGNP